MNNYQEELNEEDVLLKQKIEAEIDKCPTPEVCAKIKNHQEKMFCISYIFNMVKNMGMTISEGIGQLEAYLMEENL
jgi:hypothetical protein